MEFSVIKEAVGITSDSKLFIYKLKKDGILQVCPHSGNDCTSKCPFFMYDEQPIPLFIKLNCTSKEIKLFLA